MSWPPKHIMVAVDAEPIGDRALAEQLVDDAAVLAQVAKARLTLLFASAPLMTPILPPTEAVNDAARAFMDIADARHKGAVRLLDDLVLRARGIGVEARPLLASRSSSVPQAIAEVASEEGADLLVLASHGRRGLDRLLLGSVAERAAHLSRVPVLMLPPR